MNLLKTLNENLNPVKAEETLKKIETEMLYKILPDGEYSVYDEMDGYELVIVIDILKGRDAQFKLGTNKETIEWYYFDHEPEKASEWTKELEPWREDIDFLKDFVTDNIHDVKRSEC